MKSPVDLQSIIFMPLSEAKARLSALVRQLMADHKSLILTTNGRPTAALLSYQEYLNLLTHKPSPSLENSRLISLKEWKQGRQKRQKVLESVTSLFDVPALGRKGQKKYKQEAVRDFSS
jgi:prevent-host-death family protein